MDAVKTICPKCSKELNLAKGEQLVMCFYGPAQVQEHYVSRHMELIVQREATVTFPGKAISDVSL